MGRVRRTTELNNGTAGAALERLGETTAHRIVFAPEAAQAFSRDLQEALRQPAATVTIDMAEVAYLSPQALETLAAAGAHARAAGKELLLDHVQTPVYKTMQLAKLAAYFRRVHHG